MQGAIHFHSQQCSFLNQPLFFSLLPESSYLSMQKAKYVSVYLPGEESWYDLRSASVYKAGHTHKYEVSQDSIPSFQRAGTIIPRKDRLRRSSTQMENDPYTLVTSISCSFFEYLFFN